MIVLEGMVVDVILKVVVKCLKEKLEFKNELRRDEKKEGESRFRGDDIFVSFLNNLY